MAKAPGNLRYLFTSSNHNKVTAKFKNNDDLKLGLKLPL